MVKCYHMCNIATKYLKLIMKHSSKHVKDKVITSFSITISTIHDKQGDAQNNDSFQPLKVQIFWYNATEKNASKNAK